jgi:hypothetical protein
VSNVEAKTPDPAWLTLVASLVLHAQKAGLRRFAQAQEVGQTSRIEAELGKLTHLTPDDRGALLNTWLQNDLVHPVAELLRVAAVEGLERSEIYARVAALGEATATRLFVDRGVH